MNSMKNASVYASEDYHRIAEAIAFMRQHHLNQPNLATVAQHIGLSEYHFHQIQVWRALLKLPFGATVLASSKLTLCLCTVSCCF
jgi:hypothetical protein